MGLSSCQMTKDVIVCELKGIALAEFPARSGVHGPAAARVKPTPTGRVGIRVRRAGWRIQRSI